MRAEHEQESVLVCNDTNGSAIPPNGSIDRAVSLAATEMLSWTKDPATCELLEQQRYRLFLRWAEGDAVPVYKYAYGLWDK
jgi:hypothetical protein